MDHTNMGSAEKTVSFNRIFIFVSLFSFFFIASPYWILAQSNIQKFFFLILTLGPGFAWAYIASYDLKIHIKKVEWRSCVILFFILACLNYRAITSVIPWRGDEYYHISFTMKVAHFILMKATWLLPLSIIILLLFYGAWRRSRLILSISILIFLCPILFLLNFNLHGWFRSANLYNFKVALSRYPFTSRWFHTLIPILVKPFGSIYHEALFRIIPFISVVIFACLCQRNRNFTWKWLNIVLGIAVATVPLIFYYSSILYLEMPAVVLMTLVCFRIKELMHNDFKHIRQNPCWYALILIGFIKETTIPFLFSFLLCRLIMRFVHLLKRKIDLGYCIDELKIFFCTLFPLVLYVFFRNYFGIKRGFSVHIDALINFKVYAAIIYSFIEQFGPFCILFLVGCMLLWKEKKYSTFFFLITTFIAIPLFHAVDTVELTGYSRFNLFLIPSLITGSLVFLDFITQKKESLSFLVLSVVIAINLFLSPVNIDGTKKPYWGNSLCDTSEHYYPYRKALLWLKEKHSPDHIMFAGMYFSYYFDFYFNKFIWHPQYTVINVSKGQRNDRENLLQSLYTASENNFEIVVYHVLGENIPDIDNAYGFFQEKIFVNKAHSIMVFTR